MRKRNSKVFMSLGVGGESKRVDLDFYATDPIAIDKLLKMETFSNYVWECACGSGNLSKRLLELGYKVKSSDIVNRGFESEIIDFLKIDLEENSFNGDIITNPPYKHQNEFILNSYKVINKGYKVAMLLKIQTLETVKRYEEIFSKIPPKSVNVFVRRLVCASNNKFDEKPNSAMCYAWFIWEKGYKGETIIKWIV